MLLTPGLSAGTLICNTTTLCTATRQEPLHPTLRPSLQVLTRSFALDSPPRSGVRVPGRFVILHPERGTPQQSGGARHTHSHTRAHCPVKNRERSARLMRANLYEIHRTTTRGTKNSPARHRVTYHFLQSYTRSITVREILRGRYKVSP